MITEVLADKGTDRDRGPAEEQGAGLREKMEPKLKALGEVPTIFGELPLEWLYVHGNESLPVQLDMKRVISVLELPFTDPDIFWKLP